MEARNDSKFANLESMIEQAREGFCNQLRQAHNGMDAMGDDQKQITILMRKEITHIQHKLTKRDAKEEKSIERIELRLNKTIDFVGEMIDVLKLIINSKEMEKVDLVDV